ncbi:sulfurtransferase [Micromonospora tulbaghiae]|uniref:Sulfurtransferase n=1 Tax=Micromonospora tulbaghiae TaxID=479978 RepID=A0A386WIE5_9ACTN|nr:rhodanese-like domain-containing protein [Micromonospora tulbaghiae]AYF27891.1 sulfurtransferase [Micromonospora tulbaghiae]
MAQQIPTTATERCPVPPPGSRGIDEILAAARARLRRLDPEQAHLACRGGALLVDIRPAAQRAAQGTVPGSLVVERNVLEWRFDPRCAARLPQATGYDVPVIVLCQEGYTSSLAAAALQDIGLHRATDVIGGFAAWQIAGLPTLGPTPPTRPSSAAPPVTAGGALR